MRVLVIHLPVMPAIMIAFETFTVAFILFIAWLQNEPNLVTQKYSKHTAKVFISSLSHLKVMNNFLADVFALTDFMSLAKLPIQVSVVTTKFR